MGPEKEKEQETAGSFNAMNNSLSATNNGNAKEISMNIIKDSTRVHTPKPTITQQVQSIASNTLKSLSPNFTSSVPYDSSQIAEYILNVLPERPGENEIFDSFLKSRENMTIYNMEERPSNPVNIKSSSSPHPTKNDKHISQIASKSGQQFANQKRRISSGYFGTSDPVIISDEDEEKNERRVSKNTKQSNYILFSNEEEEDHAWITEKERMVKLYSHKLHLRKPRMQDPNLCSHEIEFLSDFDDDD
ncbi:2942_t:CDS:2 [Acaulospora morrowiae]|uniref:2942_t:CDS:1 n=1 Tax=Acaulospora morrowiae TaxID=94023 RepID=A0A9N9ATI9_9GLOM|nr:2942_t:CDS:2 [Acaulospora morrowiae]